MIFMNIQETLYFIRKNKKITQKELLNYADSSVYSKIESGKKNLRVSELTEILENLSIPFDEFSKYADIEKEQKNFRTLMKAYKMNTKDKQVKSELISYFNSLDFSKNMPLNQLSNYVLIKTFFSSQLKEIHELTKEELKIIYSLLSNKNYFFHYDYAILANTIYLFDDYQIDILVSKAFPVPDMNYRNSATKEFITNLINNLITTLLRKKDYKECEHYLLVAKQEKGNYDITYKIVINFLENLVLFLKTNERKYAELLTGHINYLNLIGESELSQNLNQELETLLSKKKENSIILRNHFNQ